MGGFSLIENMVGIAMFGIASVAIMSLVGYSFLASRGAESSRSASNFAFQIKEVLWQQHICTGNFRGTSIALNASTKFAEVKGYKLDLTLDPDNPSYFKVGAIQDALLLDSMTLVTKTKVSDTSYLGEISLDFKQQTTSVGNSDYFRKFPIIINVDATSKLESCSGLNMQTMLAQDRICDIVSNGRAYFDGTKCASKYHFQCFAGAGISATCPAGWKIQDPEKRDPYAVPGVSCEVDKGGDTFSLKVPKTPREYVGIGVVESSPMGYVLKPDIATNTCNCYWAVDGLTGNWGCKACCEKCKDPALGCPP